MAPPPHLRLRTAPTASGPGWLVGRTDLAAGLTAFRYAYMGGAAANVVVKTIAAGTVDHDELARMALSPPPPPKRKTVVR